MMDAGELKFQQLSNRPEKKIGKKNSLFDLLGFALLKMWVE